jgi:OmpA-OmpF porin, OOP family
MKILFPFFLAVLCLFPSTSRAQNSEFRNAVHAKLNLIDYGVLNSTDFKPGQGFELGVFRNVSKFLNVGIPGKIGLVRLPNARVNTVIASADLVAHLGDMRPSTKFSPYFFGGAGLFTEKFTKAKVQFPFGGGLHYRLSKYAYINGQVEMRKAMIDNRDNFQIGIGYVYLLHKPEMQDMPPVLPPIDDTTLDTDADGTLDMLDHCPTQVGPAIALGCPDADLDSIADFEDRCPDARGSIMTQGCPDIDNDGFADIDDKCPDASGSIKGCPDKDSDGFADFEDKCPEQSGRWNGCPDADFDGVPDKEDKCPNDPGSAENGGCPTNKKDSDGDGFPDDMDKCPNQSGPLAGCPDKDSDGFADQLDQCPNESGKLNGCPDTDGDGFADKDDPCPKLAGVEGPCPTADADGDGIVDSADKCPNIAGIAGNNGCPEIKQEVQQRLDFAKRAVQFETGKATLKGSSFQILDEIYTILVQNPDFHLVISGHTDDIGDDAKNMNLSTQRAKTCHDYFLFKGIAQSKLRFLGFGEFKPIAENTSQEGRELNRRVEFEVTFQ